VQDRRKIERELKEIWGEIGVAGAGSEEFEGTRVFSLWGT